MKCIKKSKNVLMEGQIMSSLPLCPLSVRQTDTHAHIHTDSDIYIYTQTWIYSHTDTHSFSL